ncbi:MAG: gamma carbonic anhydrase family protein [Cellvibrionales bacterium]|nr:gamma carbonic anhydrase family protein [Cellvibrionales bacterium]
MKHCDQSFSIRSFGEKVPQLGERVFIDRSAVVIGDVTIGDDSSIWPQCALRGDMHFIRIGKRTSIQDVTLCHVTHDSDYNPEGYPLVIGDDCTIAHQVTLHGCKVGNRVLVGMGATVMDGAVIEDDVVVGAGSLVPPGKTLASGFLYLGSPVKQVRPLTENEMAFFTYSANNYRKLKDQYLLEDEAE